MATKITAGRAQILASQTVSDIQGTMAVLAAGSNPVACYTPVGAVGVLLYITNSSARMRYCQTASTALTAPQSGYLRANTEYSFTLNPSSGTAWISLLANVASTAQVSWILGAGA